MALRLALARTTSPALGSTSRWLKEPPASLLSRLKTCECSAQAFRCLYWTKAAMHAMSHKRQLCSCVNFAWHAGRQDCSPDWHNASGLSGACLTKTWHNPAMQIPGCQTAMWVLHAAVLDGYLQKLQLPAVRVQAIQRQPRVANIAGHQQRPLLLGGSANRRRGRRPRQRAERLAVDEARQRQRLHAADQHGAALRSSAQLRQPPQVHLHRGFRGCRTALAL